MNFNKCSRCGSFYISNNDVCPKCETKDAFEFGQFKTYVEENGITNDLNILSSQTGISIKNLNRYMGYEGYNNLSSKKTKL